MDVGWASTVNECMYPFKSFGMVSGQAWNFDYLELGCWS